MIFNIVRAFCPILVAILAVTGCQVSSDAHRIIEPAADTLLADRAGGHVHIGDKAIPNPVGVQSITTRTVLYAPRHFSDLDQECEGFVSRQPALVVIADEDLEEVSVSVSRNADLLLIDHPDGRTSCIFANDDGELIVNTDWLAGTSRIYVGKRDRFARFTYDVVFENHNDRQTIPWYADTSIPHFENVGQMAKPEQAFLATRRNVAAPSPAIRPEFDCLDDHLIASDRPLARVTVKEETNAGLTALADTPVDLVLVGPISDDGRNLPKRCLGERTHDNSLEAGDYFVFLGFSATSTPDSMELVVHDDSSEIDRRFIGTTPPKSLSVAARAIQNHYPFISANTLWSRDRLRAYLLETAPDELFVALTADAEEARLFVATDSHSGYRYRSPRDGEIPRAGEVALLIDRQGRILTIDGLIYSISLHRLAPAEEIDEFYFPSQERTPRLAFYESLSLAGSDDQTMLHDHQRRHQRYEFCVEDFYSASDEEIETLVADGASRVEIDDLVDRLESEAQQECNYTEVRRQDSALHEELQKARTQRRQLHMQDHRERLESLAK